MTRPKRPHPPIDRFEDVPAFSSEAEEAEFWASHELGPEPLSRMELRPEGILPRARPPATPISLRMDTVVLAEVKELAARCDTPYQTLLKRLVVAGLAAERASGHRAIRAEIVPFLQGSSRRDRVQRQTDAVRRRGHVLSYSS